MSYVNDYLEEAKTITEMIDRNAVEKNGWHYQQYP